MHGATYRNAYVGEQRPAPPRGVVEVPRGHTPRRSAPCGRGREPKQLLRGIQDHGSANHQRCEADGNGTHALVRAGGIVGVLHRAQRPIGGLRVKPLHAMHTMAEQHTRHHMTALVHEGAR